MRRDQLLPIAVGMCSRAVCWGFARPRIEAATVVSVVLIMAVAPALAALVQVDPPPLPSGGSRAELRQPGMPVWMEIPEVMPAEGLSPLLRSDPVSEAESVLVTPTPTVQWDAIAQTTATGVRPPDDTLAAGPGAGAAGRVVETTNQSVQIYNKTGATVAGPTALSTMFPPAAGTFVFDPKVLFDQASGRFMIVALEVGFSAGTCTSALNSGRIRMAVSTTGTPNNLTTNWIFLNGPVNNGLIVIGGATTWADYPSLGADGDAVFVTTNQFDAACTYRGANIRVFNKASLLAGVYASVDVTFDNAVTTGTFTVQPAHVYGATDNGRFYLISRLGPTTYRLYSITGDPGAPVAATGLFPWTAGAFPADTTADQCTVATPDLDTLATRIQNAVYRNGNLWCTGTSDPDGDGQTEVVWHQIRTNSFPSAAPAVAQSGFINGGGTPSPWTYMPSINVNSTGDAMINFEQSSTAQCPQVRATIRLNADPPGTFQAPVTVRASAGFYDSVSTSANDRWGDYSGAAVDPTDQCFWLVNEFSALTAVDASRWGTHIAKICTSTEGACCFGARICGMRTAANCSAQGGTFRGVGSKCPTQNVQSVMHQGGPVVHWVDPAVNCNNITPLAPLGPGSDCCTPHTGPACDSPSCAASVCNFLPHCCQVSWDQGCVQQAEKVCGGLCGPGGQCNPSFKIDPWITLDDPDHQTCDPSPPIPPGFFGPGSDPFVGTICYQGQPLGATPYGDFDLADTLVRRPPGDPFDRCAAPPQPDTTIPIQIVALNLVSVQPIVVTYNGGQNPQLWDVRVGLSSVDPPPGNMTVRKTHANGGTWDSTLPVQPLFTFTQVGNPSNVRVMDTGVDGMPPIIFQTPGEPWVSDLDPNLHLAGAECTNFHPGIQDPNQSAGDCNQNGVRDDCDIAQGLSADCNQNGTPDECDLDLDFDSVIDDCDNCPAAPNPNQANSDFDPFGDACDLCPFLTERREGDHDGDKVLDYPNADFPIGDNCPCVSNFGQQDSDGDGTGDACETAAAGDVKLTLLVGKQPGGNLKLNWGNSCVASDNDYSVYEGTIGGTFTGHFPRACSTGGLTTLTLSPPPFDAYYLIVPTNGAVEGTYGNRTSGPRPPSPAACRPQAVQPCP